jgi:hypothetical protein
VSFGEVPNLSLWQKLQLRFSGSAFVRWSIPEGYRDFVAVYVVQCKRHGLYLDNPHGVNERYFNCPNCKAEKYFGGK